MGAQIESLTGQERSDVELALSGAPKTQLPLPGDWLAARAVGHTRFRSSAQDRADALPLSLRATPAPAGHEPALTAGLLFQVFVVKEAPRLTRAKHPRRAGSVAVSRGAFKLS
jgi:hypothetical protein